MPRTPAPALIMGCHFGNEGKKGIARVIQLLHGHFGADCGQIFVGSPQAPNLSDALVAKWMQEAEQIRAAREQCGGFKLYVHAPYTLNFCMKVDGESSRGQPNTDKYWINAVMVRLRIADAMGAEGVILHMGKAVKLSLEEAEQVFHDNVCEVLNGIREEKIKAKLIIETSAGQGTELYPTKDNSLEGLVRFWGRFTTTQKKHLGMCVDTCHIFAAGYNIGTEAGNKKFWEEWDEKLGLESLTVVHMNNSVKGHASRVDRHAPLGMGRIGMSGLCGFARSATMVGIPMVIETPLCQFDIEVLSDMVSKSPAMLAKRDWESWFKERHLQNVFANLGVA